MIMLLCMFCQDSAGKTYKEQGLEAKISKDSAAG